MKIFIFLFSLLLVHKPSIDQIKLPKTQRVVNTFSGNCNEEKSFHLIVTKNLEEKQYNILTYIFDDGEIQEMPVIKFDKKVEVMSFHANNDIVTLITKTKIDKKTSIEVIDVSSSSGTITRSDLVFDTEDLKTIMRSDDKNVLIYTNKEEISLVTINSADQVKESFIIKNEKNKRFINRLADLNLGVINTDEYVKNGSITEFKAYFNDDNIIITQDNESKGDIKILELSTSVDGQQFVEVESFDNDTPDILFKKNSSYLSDDQLFQLKVGKKDAHINVFNITDGSKKTIDLTNPEILSISSDKEAAQNYKRKAAKNKNQPTITINKAKNNAYTLRMDYVNKNTYQYYNNWWWHHNWMLQQQQWMMQQQQQQVIQQHMRNLQRFGPNPEHYDAILLLDNPLVKKKNVSFEIGINANGEFVESSTLETIHKKIDKQKIIKQLERDRNYRHVSTTFNDDSYVYMAYNKENKSFQIIEKQL